MKVINIGEHNSIFNQFISEIRNVEIQKDPLRFRRNLERIGELFAYEISKTFSYQPSEVQTPLGTATVLQPAEQPVIATILRAGLPLHQGLLNYFDLAGNAFISAYRKHTTGNEFEIEFGYLSSPCLDGKIVILSDPMLATGSSMEVGYNALLAKGTPKYVHFVSAIASKAGVDYCNTVLPVDNCTLWVGAIDKVLNDNYYIVPGLGDAGDLAYGEKMD